MKKLLLTKKKNSVIYSTVVDNENNFIFIGVIGNAKGLKGQILVNYFAKDIDKFKSYEYFYIGEDKKKYKVKKHYSLGDSFSLKFIDVKSRDEAENLKSKDIFIDSGQLESLSDENWYHSDLLGLNVETITEKKIGKIKAIYNFGASDIIEVMLNSGKVEMIPFTKDFVYQVIAKKKLIIKEMDI